MFSLRRIMAIFFFWHKETKVLEMKEIESYKICPIVPRVM